MFMTNKKEIEQKIGKDLKKVSLNHLKPLEKEILNNGYFTASYDVSRPQGSNFDEIAYTEVFKNAVYVTPLNDEMAYKMINLAYKNYSGKVDDDLEKLKSKISFIDKYKSKTSGINSKSICFLAGSNCLKASVSINTLKKWIYLDSELLLKPHPLTNEEDLKDIVKTFGISRVLDKDISAFELLNQAKRVYTTSASELGLNAKLLGKEVIDITRFTLSSQLTYSPLYRYLNYPYELDDLVKVLSNPLSGVFFQGDENKVKEYFFTLLKMKDMYKNLSNSDFIR